ncbi:poly(ADP-ribose) glycohydrolase domain-containing protein [Chryseobacterium proteolyticum]|uniref:poly(ADP-ribose) glycohydrolase domain-containing protein n=1 Tax=Chryseobacterium proteolyticum TaxID=118127 RepID=UPI003982E056
MTNKGMAKNTLEILANKYYINTKGKKIELSNEIEICKKETVLFTSDELSILSETIKEKKHF